jgi:proteic killer suppression protein
LGCFSFPAARRFSTSLHLTRRQAQSDEAAAQLKRLYEEDSAKGVPPESVDKLRKIFGFLDDMQDPEELPALSVWKVLTLTGDRKGTWSLSVTRNRRLTFRVDHAEHEICDVNLEDYH